MGSTCPQGKVLEAGLCYEMCKPGFKGFVTACYGICPENFTDAGLFCTKDLSRYWNSNGYNTKGECETSCSRNAKKGGCSKCGSDGSYFPNCESGYTREENCEHCFQKCPEGFSDSGVGTCNKPSHGRGVGTIPTTSWITTIIVIIVVLLFLWLLI